MNWRKYASTAIIGIIIGAGSVAAYHSYRLAAVRAEYAERDSQREAIITELRADLGELEQRGRQFAAEIEREADAGIRGAESLEATLREIESLIGELFQFIEQQNQRIEQLHRRLGDSPATDSSGT